MALCEKGANIAGQTPATKKDASWQSLTLRTHVAGCGACRILSVAERNGGVLTEDEARRLGGDIIRKSGDPWIGSDNGGIIIYDGKPVAGLA